DRRRLLRRGDRASRRDDDIDLQPDEFGCNLGIALVASLRPAILDCDGATFDPAELAQPLHKGGGIVAPSSSRGRAHQPDGRQLAGLLRTRGERPHRRCRTAQTEDELAPFHSITSLASARSAGGMAMPSPFAVLRLIVSSNLVGVCTGRSPGFSPFRMRLT